MHITIVGGGFGGVKAALEIARDRSCDVTLITDRPDFQYYPTLYSAATGRSHRESWIPLGEIFADYPNVDVFIDEIVGINPKKCELKGESGTVYEYSEVIFSIGVVTTYFNIPGLEAYAYGIKSEAEIQKLKHRLFIDIAEQRQYDRNYIIVGAGPTGVELAASLGTYIKRLAQYYELKERPVTIRLIEAAPRVLPRMSEETSRRVEYRLKTLGIKVQTNKKVEKATSSELIVSGKSIESHTIIWTSGVANHPFFAAHPKVFTLNERGKVVVDEYMQAAPNIYVIGDNADTPHSGLAQTALHDGLTVAKNILRKHSGRDLEPYRTVTPAHVVPVGPHWAAFEWKGFRVYGLAASWLRRAANLIGYRDILPIGTAIGAWKAGKVYENDYFTPSGRVKKRR